MRRSEESVSEIEIIFPIGLMKTEVDDRKLESRIETWGKRDLL